MSVTGVQTCALPIFRACRRGKREHFWRQLSNSVQAPVVDQPTQVSVEISDPRTRQKIEGGTITAKRVKNLAIPQTAEAYGRSPATFERETGLKLIFIKQGEGSLARIFLASRANPNSTVLQVEYVLKHSVTQKADPTALPPQAELEASVIDASQAALDRQLAQGGNQP